MNNKFIRIYQELDISEIKDHMLIYGDLSGNCSKCKALDIKLDAAKCPSCQTEFKYIAFRNIKNHLPKIQKLKVDRPDVVLIDFDDYKRLVGEFQAHEFFK